MGPQLEETVANSLPAPNDAGNSVPSLSKGTVGHDYYGQKDVFVHDISDSIGGSDGMIAHHGSTTHHDAAPLASQPENGESEEEIGAFDDSHLQVDQEKKKRKKKSKKKPKSKRGLNAPTGFEEYNADAPITPAEFEEDRQLYDLDLPFTERIITAIHRYERRRKMNPTTRDVFYKYLAYGGLDVGPNMFQGVSARDADSMDKDTLTSAMAQSSLSSDFRDVGKESSQWVVDFEGVMKGFLSRRVPYFYALDTTDDVRTVTDLLSNFMNYLLHHEVCPEYCEPVLAARQCCFKATVELWSIRQAQKWLPGDFNIACSTLFEGTYSKRYDGKTSWKEDEGGFVGQTDDQARQIVKFAVACAGSEEQYQLWYRKAMANEIKVTKVRRDIGLEITEIIPPDDETRDYYKQKTKDFRPVGKIRTKGWINPSAPPADLTPEEQALRRQTGSEAKRVNGELHQDRAAEEDEYEFFVEEAVLQHLFVGMKMEVTVRTLNCGIYFVDEVLHLYLSFDTFLPNERMYGYKKPRYLNGFSMGEDGLVRYDLEEIGMEEGVEDDAADDGD